MIKLVVISVNVVTNMKAPDDISDMLSICSENWWTRNTNLRNAILKNMIFRIFTKYTESCGTILEVTGKKIYGRICNFLVAF